MMSQQSILAMCAAVVSALLIDQMLAEQSILSSVIQGFQVLSTMCGAFEAARELALTASAFICVVYVARCGGLSNMTKTKKSRHFNASATLMAPTKIVNRAVSRQAQMLQTCSSHQNGMRMARARRDSTQTL